MKLLVCSLLAFFAVIYGVNADSISSPTANSVWYPNDTVTITWDKTMLQGTIRILLTATDNVDGYPPTSTWLYAEYSAVNTGTYIWKVPTNIVAKTTSFRLEITGEVPYKKLVSQNFQVRFGKTRPAGLSMGIQKTVYISWQAVYAHSYEIQASNDLKTWDVLGTVTAHDEDMGVTVLADGNNLTFRMIDVSQ